MDKTCETEMATKFSALDAMIEKVQSLSPATDEERTNALYYLQEALLASADDLSRLAFSFFDTGNNFVATRLAAFSTLIQDAVGKYRKISRDLVDSRYNQSNAGVGVIIQAALNHCREKENNTAGA